MATRLSTLPDYESIYNPQDVIPNNANQYGNIKLSDRNARKKWKVFKDEGFSYVTEDEIDIITLEGAGPKYKNREERVENYIKTYNGEEVTVYEITDPKTGDKRDVEVGELIDLEEHEDNFSMMAKLLEDYDNAYDDIPLTKEQRKQNELLGLSTEHRYGDDVSKGKQHFKKRGMYSSEEILAMKTGFYYHIKEREGSKISQKAIFNSITSLDGFKVASNDLIREHYKNLEKVNWDSEEAKELDALFTNRMNELFEFYLKNSGQDLLWKNQALVEDIDQFFSDMVVETTTRENRAAESLLGIPLHKSDLLTGIWEFTKMFKMGHNGMKLMGTGKLADDKRTELQRFRELIKDGETTVVISERYGKRSGQVRDVEYNLKEIEKKYAEDLFYLEKQMLEIMLDNESVQQQLEKIGETGVFNEEGEFDITWDKAQSIIGKQGGQMLGLIFTLGYSSMAQHTSEIYMNTLKEQAVADKYHSGNVNKISNKSRKAFFNLDIQEQNEYMLNVIESGRGAEGKALFAGGVATALDAFITRKIATSAAKGLKNIWAKLMKDSLNNNIRRLAAGGAEIGKLTGYEVGTEWAQDLTLKFGQQSSLGKTMWPQYGWFNDKSWIGTAAEVIIATPFIWGAGRVGSTVVNNTWRQIRKLTNKEDIEHAFSLQRQRMDKDLENGKISNEEYINQIDNIEAMRMIVDANPKLKHSKFAKVLLETGSNDQITEMHKSVLQIVQDAKSTKDVLDEFKKLQEDNPTVDIKSSYLNIMDVDVMSDEFQKNFKKLPQSVQSDIYRLIQKKENLKKSTEEAHSSFIKLMMKASFNKTAQEQVQALNDENLDTPSYLFDDKKAFQNHVKNDAISRLVEAGMSKDAATKIINENIKNGYIYKNPKPKSYESNINVAYEGLFQVGNVEATTPNALYVIKGNAYDLIDKGDLFAFNGLSHGALHVSMRRASLEELRKFKKDLESGLKEAAKTDPFIAQLLTIAQLSEQRYFGKGARRKLNRNSRKGIEEYITNLGDVAALLQLQEGNLQTISSFDKIADGVKKWFGLYRPRTKSINTVDGSNFIDFLKAGSHINRPLPRLEFLDMPLLEKKELERLSKDETAFSEAFEKDYEAKINEAYTPDLQNLEEINNLFSEIIQKEAYRTRPSGARWVDLPNFDMAEFVKETLYGVNDETGKMRGISQFIWGDKAFDPNINDNFFSYVRRNLTNRAMDALKSGKVSSQKFTGEIGEVQDAGVNDKEYEITVSKTSPFRTLITDEDAELIKNDVKNKAKLIPDFNGFYTKMKNLYSSYLNPIVENLQYTEEQYNTYVNSDKFKSKVNKINEKRKKKLTQKQINGLARIDLREKWLRKSFSTIFPNLPQKVLNKNFQDLKQPKLDENGKHIRIGNDYQFESKDITEDDWVNYFLGEFEGKASAIVDESGYKKTNTTGDTRWDKLMKEIEVQLRFEGLASLLNDTDVVNKIQTTRDLEEYEKLKNEELIGRIATSIDKDTDVVFMEKFGGVRGPIPMDLTGDMFAKQALELTDYLSKTKGLESAKFQRESLKYHPFVVDMVIYANTEFSEFDGSINRNFGKLVERNKYIDAQPTKSLRGNERALKNLQKAGVKVIDRLLKRYGYGLIDAYEGTSAETKINKFLDMFGYINRALDPAGKFKKDRDKLIKRIKGVKYKDGVDLTGIRLMNTRFKLYKDVQKILKLTSKAEKLAKLKELAPEIEEANRVNIEVVKGLATDLIDLLKDPNGITKVEFLDLLQVQGNAVGGIKGLSALDFIEIREGSQAINEENSKYEEIKNKYIPQVNKEIDDILAGRNENIKELTIVKNKKRVKVSREEYFNYRIKKLINADIKNYGEHMGANSLTMASIAEIAFRSLEDPNMDIQTELEKIFLVHTQLLTSGEIADILDTNPETGKKTLKVNPDNIYRTIKLLSKEQLENIYGYDGRPMSEVIIDFQKRYLELEQKSKRNRALNEIAREENFYKSVLTGNESVEEQIEIFKVIDKARNIANDPKAKRKGISMFDLDFTLLNTTEKIKVTMPDGTETRIDGAEFAEQATDLIAMGAEFDFTEFNNIINAEKGPFFDMAKARAGKKGWNDIFIVTARSHEAKNNIYNFMRGMGFDIKLDNIITLQNGTPQAKAQWLLSKAAEGYNDFGVYDDHSGVIDAANNLISWLDIDSEVQQAGTNFSEQMNEEFRQILFESKGVNVFDNISGAQAEARGVVADEFSLMPPSADDFLGLLYQFMGKGKQGDAHKEWLVKTLIRPYSKAMRDVDTAKQTLVDSYRTLKKEHKDVIKILKKDTGYGGFNYESALRVFLWDQNGIEIPGISKRDLRNLNGIVTSDPNLVDFANKLGKITKLDAGYVQPTEWWVTGTIGQDFRNIGDEYRKMFLTDWIRNKDLVFDAQTLRVIQANYGTNFKEALTDVLYRMENGRMSPDSGHKFVNNFNQFINGSIGTTMFLNTRSAVLQTISAINYVNWSDNNPIKAGAAFANQPQFWKDFMYIFQSDMLKQRRSNLAFEVTANELATAVQKSGDKARAAVQYLLRKGFLPTQMADSFAIAFGGASMYRNRINTYTKQGLSLKEAQKKAWLDFQEITEASQQSAREHMLSAEQASPLGRLILAFGNTPAQYNRLMKKSYLDLVNNRGDHRTNISKIIYYGAVQNFMFYSMQNALFAMIFDPDEGEGEDDKYLSKKINTINSMSDTILRGLGIRGATISTLKNMIIEFGEQNQKDWNSDYAEVMVQALNISPPVGIKARQIYGATQTYKYNKKVINEMGPDIDNPAWLALGQITAGTTNIPLDRVIKKVNNVRAALDDRNEAWQRIATMLGWNTWNVGIPNRKRDAVRNKKKQKNKSGAVTEYEQLLKDLGINE